MFNNYYDYYFIKMNFFLILKRFKNDNKFLIFKFEVNKMNVIK